MTTCLNCTDEFTGKRSDSKFCTSTCRDKYKYVANRERILEHKRSTYDPSTEKYKQVWSKYRLTPEAYDALVAKGCAICGEMENLHIDHDHACCPTKARSCGKCIRAALCARCNLAEGLLDSDSDKAFRLAVYNLQNTNVLELL